MPEPRALDGVERRFEVAPLEVEPGGVPADEIGDLVRGDSWCVAIGDDDQFVSLVETMDDADGRLEGGARSGRDRDGWLEFESRLGRGDRHRLEVLDSSDGLEDRRVGPRGRVDRLERLLAEDLDPSVVEVHPGPLADLPEVGSVEQFDAAALSGSQLSSVLLGRTGEPTGSHDHSPDGTVVVVGDDRRVELLDDGSAHGVGALALDDDRAAATVDGLLHQDIPPLVGRSCRPAHVLVAEVAKHVHHQILEFVSRELVEWRHHVHEFLHIRPTIVFRHGRETGTGCRP